MGFLKRLVLWFAPWLCRWHKGEPAVTYDPEGEATPAYCPECSRMLDTKECARCGKSFIDWESQQHDDIMAGAMVSDGGDVCCAGCYVPEGNADQEGAFDEPDVD